MEIDFFFFFCQAVLTDGLLCLHTRNADPDSMNFIYLTAVMQKAFKMSKSKMLFSFKQGFLKSVCWSDYMDL